jgi:hypothetical protein
MSSLTKAWIFIVRPTWNRFYRGGLEKPKAWVAGRDLTQGVAAGNHAHMVIRHARNMERAEN